MLTKKSTRLRINNKMNRKEQIRSRMWKNRFNNLPTNCESLKWLVLNRKVNHPSILNSHLTNNTLHIPKSRIRSYSFYLPSKYQTIPTAIIPTVFVLPDLLSFLCDSYALTAQFPAHCQDLIPLPFLQNLFYHPLHYLLNVPLLLRVATYRWDLVNFVNLQPMFSQKSLQLSFRDFSGHALGGGHI